MKGASSAPIGVFDSGIGGLTVLRALRARLPEESFIYLGDTARLPYGSKSAQTIRRYTEQNLKFLAARGVKAVVIACNSASTQFRDREWNGLPVYNVIDPGAREAARVTTRGRIGLMGTRATVGSGAYEVALKALRPELGVFAQACPLLVPLAEEGLDGDPISNLIVFRYLQPLMQHQIDTLILGCTHYPLLEGSIQRVTRDDVRLVDSGAAVAEDVAEDLKSGRLAPTGVGGDGRTTLLLTDDSEAFRGLARRILGPDFREPERVDTI